MFAAIRFGVFVLFAAALLIAGYAAYRAATGEYNYDTFIDGVYNEGCPFPVPNAFPPYGRGVECRWQKSGYSGFELGMSKSRLLEILCNGNFHGKYRAPLRALTSPQSAPKEESTYIMQVIYKEFPCADRNALNRYSTFKFGRHAAAWELKRHEEHFTLVFVRGTLARIELVRYSQLFPDINFQIGESFGFLKKDDPDDK